MREQTKVQQIALDIHAHQAPVDAAVLAGLDGVVWDAAAAVLVVDGHKVGMKPLFSPLALIAWLDANQIAAAWISAPPPLYRQHLGEAEATRWVDYVNRGLVAIADGHAGRLTALPHLPIEHPNLAAAVAAQEIAAGRTRFSAPTGGPGRVLSDRAYEKLWRTLDEASAFVLFHPGENDDARLAPFYLSNLLGNPYETTVAIAHLVFGGVIDRNPQATFCFAHGGGAAAMLAGRFEQGFRTDRPGIDKTLASPQAALRRLMVDCVTHDSEALRLAETVFGRGHVVFGSDWPFPMGLMTPHAQVAALSPDQHERILRTNIAPWRA